MPHGYPDHGVGAPSSTIYPVLDIGELAARLGSINTFDRRGNVIWLDDFETNLKHWYSSAAPLWTGIEKSDEAARNANYSCKLTTPTAIDTVRYIGKYLPLPTLSKIGFEFSYAMYLDIKYIYCKLSFLHTTGKNEFALRYDRYNRTLAYLNSSGSYTDLSGTPSHNMLYHAWNTIKLVVDYKTKKYVRALLNSFSWDLKDIAGDSDTAYYTPSLWIETRIQNRSAGEHYVYIDDAIITQNEP